VPVPDIVALAVKFAHNFDDEEKFLLSPSLYLCMEGTHRKSRETWGDVNSGTHGERAMKAFIAGDGLF